MKKQRKQPPKQPESWRTKLLNDAKHFLATTPKQYLYISVAAVVAIAGVTTYALVNPSRSEAKFCSTLTTGMDEIQGRYKASSSEGSLTQMGVLMNNMSEFSKLLRDLHKVAPSEIEDDMKVVSEAWDKSIDDGTKNGATAVTNPLGALSNGLAGGLASAIKNGASYKAVDDYTSTHCGRTLFAMTGTQAAGSDTTTDPDTIALDTVADTNFKPWEAKQHGFVVQAGDTLFLIDKDTKAVTTKLELPKAQGRTPGGDSGRSFTIGYMSRDAFSPNMRYITAMYDGPNAPELAYYDLKEKKLIGTGITDSKGLNNPAYGSVKFDRTGLLYVGRTQREVPNANNGGISLKPAARFYNIDTGKEQVNPVDHEAAGVSDDTVVHDYVNNKAVTLFKITDPVLIRYNGKSSGEKGYFSACKSFNIIGLISKDRLLCISDDGLKVVDVANILANNTEKDDPDSHDYVVGRLHYHVKDVATVSVAGDVESYALSSDLKKIAYIEKQNDQRTLFTADLASGEVAKIGILNSSAEGEIRLLKWQ